MARILLIISFLMTSSANLLAKQDPLAGHFHFGMVEISNIKDVVNLMPDKQKVFKEEFNNFFNSNPFVCFSI